MTTRSRGSRRIVQSARQRSGAHWVRAPVGPHRENQVEMIAHHGIGADIDTENRREPHREEEDGVVAGAGTGVRSAIKVRSAAAVQKVRPVMQWCPDQLPSPFCIRLRFSVIPESQRLHVVAALDGQALGDVHVAEELLAAVVEPKPARKLRSASRATTAAWASCWTFSGSAIRARFFSASARSFGSWELAACRGASGPPPGPC